MKSPDWFLHRYILTMIGCEEPILSSASYVNMFCETMGKLASQIVNTSFICFNSKIILNFIDNKFEQLMMRPVVVHFFRLVSAFRPTKENGIQNPNLGD